MFKINWQNNAWFQSTIRFDDGIWLDVRRPGDYKAVPLFYNEQTTLGMDGVE